MDNASDHDSIIDLETRLYKGQISTEELKCLFKLYTMKSSDLHKNRIRDILQMRTELEGVFSLLCKLRKNHPDIPFETILQKLAQNRDLPVTKLLDSLADIQFTEEKLDFPSEIILPTTMKTCNIKCRVCSQAYEKVPTRMASMDVFLQAVEAIPPKRFCKVMLTPFAEGLASRGWFTYVELACKKRPYANIGFNTNGSHLTEDKCHAIIDAGVKYLIISLNLSTKESYLNFTGKPFFDLVEKNIRTLASLKSKKNSSYPKITVQYLNIPPVVGNEEALKARWNGIADNVFFRNVSAPMGKEKMDEYKSIFGHIPETQITLPKATPCASMFITCAIDLKGYYTQCCRLHTLRNTADERVHKYFEVGSVFDMDIQTAWRSTAWMRTRAMQYAGCAPICNACNANQTSLEILSKFKRGMEARAALGKTL